MDPTCLQTVCSLSCPQIHLYFSQMELPKRTITANAYKERGILTHDSSVTPKLLMLGDSHGGMWANTVREIAIDHNIPSSFMIMDGVSPFFRINPSKSQKTRYLSSMCFLEHLPITGKIYLLVWNPRMWVHSLIQARLTSIAKWPKRDCNFFYWAAISRRP